MKFLQWFYNPFEPHICRLSTGEYVIRRYNSDCWDWECLDRKGVGTYANRWWLTEKCITNRCTMDSLSEAKLLLKNYQPKKPKPYIVKYTERVL